MANKRTETMKKVKVTFGREGLMYDLENCGWVESQVMDENSENSRHLTADIGEEGNVDRVNRVLDMAVARCEEIAYPWVQKDLGELTELTDEVSETEDYDMELTIPVEVSASTVKLLTGQMHEYIVCRALSDWMSIVNPTRAETWEAKASAAAEEIRRIVMTRAVHTIRGRLRQHWLG